MSLTATISYHYPLFISITGCAVVGIIAGCMGSLALLKKQSLLGDTISHAALPGIVISLIIGQAKNSSLLLFGGAVSGALGTLMSMTISRKSTLAQDTILGVILSSFFGTGLLLISLLQKYEFADQAIINKFLFGNAALILEREVVSMLAVGALIFSLVALFWKEITIHIFDTEYAHAFGFSTWIIETITNTLLIITIVIGLQTVGVILMSSLLIAPAAAARQWTHNFNSLFFMSGFLGGTCAALGGLLAVSADISSGPAIVITLSICVFISLWLGTSRKNNRPEAHT